VTVADEQPDQTKGQDQNEEPLRKDEDPPEKRKRKVPPFVIIGVVALLIIVAGLFYWHSTYYEDTDDAQIAGNIEQISARVGGQVVNVAVLQEQKVEAGQLLVEIDPRDYQVAVQQAKGNMDSAEAAWHAAAQNVPVESVSASSGISSADADVRTAAAQIDQSQKQLDAAEAQVVAAQANSKKAQLDLDRYTPLVQKDVISRQQYDQVVATADAQKAALNQAQASQLAQEQAVRVSRDRLLEAQASFRNSQTGPQQVSIQRAKADQAEATYLESKAKYEQAELNLSYTKIFAPFSGIISTKSVEVGQNVGVGQSILTLVSLDNIWVEADFKETQLQHMHTGQTVKIKVDAYGKTYTGKVTQIGGATGSLLSLFPPENATGNYVKVVQRVPVRIDFTDLKDEDKNHELRPGLSVEPTVRVKE
jgi:membrane fusion protein (multidrug efflux system)